MDENTKAEIIKGTTEIVKTAYEDAFQPVAKETGKALGTIGKTVNVALSPLRGMIWGYDLIEAFIHDTVSKKLDEKGVAEEDIITPDPDIAVPTVEALRYSKLKDEFGNLLAHAMNKNTSVSAHPGFVDMLKQMSVLDAQIVKALKSKEFRPILKVLSQDSTKGGSKSLAVIYGGELAKLQLSHGRDIFSIAMDNLVRLGVVEIMFETWLSDKEQYVPLRELDLVKALKSSLLEGKYAEREGVLRLTDFGKAFKTACT